MQLTQKKNYMTIIGMILIIIFTIYGIQNGIFTSQEKMQEFVSQAGVLAPLVFLIIQIVQVVLPIIPGGVTLAIGVIVFGPIYGFLYNYIGICIGSIINFILARNYGKTFIVNMISQKNYDKYIGWLEKGEKFDIFFAIAIFLPVAPDDILCLIAGLTPMTLKRFIIIILTCKPWSIAAYSMGLTSVLKWLFMLF